MSTAAALSALTLALILSLGAYTMAICSALHRVADALEKR